MSQMKVVPRILAQCSRQGIAARAISTSIVRLDAGPERVDISRIKKLQQHYQIDDGTPIYLKGGFKDQLLFGLTVFLCVVGLGISGSVVYELAVPPKN